MAAETKNKGKISYILQAINSIPLLLFSFIIMVVGTHSFTQAMYAEVEAELSNVSSNLVTMYDVLFPGNYELVGETSYQLFKGDHNLTNDYSLIDRIKEETGLDITLFYQNTRILTTLTGENGKRIVGSGAPEVVVRDVLNTGEPKFYKKTIIYSSSFFSYYVPLCNRDGTVVGMLFVGKPTADVDASIRRALYPLLLAAILLAVLVSVFNFLYTGNIVSVLLQIHAFLKEVSAGNLNAKLSPSILRRDDELGEIGQSAITMRRSLYTLVEQDSLTFLSNRRSGDRQLREIMADSFAKGVPFCVAIGDIDFFKHINDTYGHDCGDLVLKNVAAILRSHMHGIGFAARWGGEEFLLVFKNMNPDEALASLNQLLETIRSTENEYDGQIIKVTMTFGITPGNAGSVKDLLRNADQKLYQGKTGGRDRIIS